jgi:putative two-component system response regulator
MDPTIPITSQQILVVETNEQIRFAITQILQIENYEVVQAQTGQEALSKLENIIPDLIITDETLSDMTGTEFYSALRKKQSLGAIPLVFLTSETSRESIQQLREIGVEDRLTKPIDPGSLSKIINSRLLRAAEVKIAHIDQAYLETIKVLANAIEGRDQYTRGHVDRVTKYTIWLAEALRWPSESVRILEIGARLHDIGKIVVPDQILNKPSKLNEEEWKLMRRHPIVGAKMLDEISHLQEAIPYILYHHERWDGTGYPEGLKGRNIPVGARMLAIADVFDALTTPRPYHPAKTRETVYDLLRYEAGKHFDPDLVPIFIDLIDKKSRAFGN